MIQGMETRWRYVLAVLAGVLAGGYIGSMIATIYVVLAKRGDLNSIGPLDPWFLRYSWTSMQATPDLLNGALIITSAITAALTIVGVAGVYRGSLTKYDDAHFQSKREMRKNKMIAGFTGNGFIYGKLGSPKSDKPYVSADPDRFPHAIMIAPTGRGKGVGFVKPNMLHHGGSAVVLDVKGDIFKDTSVHRSKGLNNKVWYFSPFDYVDVPATGGKPSTGRVTRTHRFNPLARIALMTSTDEQYTALNTLADLFLVVEGDSAKSFYQAGKRLFVACCLFAIEQDKPTLGYASEVMGGGGSRADNYRQHAELTNIPIVARTLIEMADETQKILDSYISVINGAGFELWNDPSVVRATSKSDFDFATFRSDQQTLYVVVQPEHLTTLAPLIRLLFADAIASLQRREPGRDEPYTVMFLMDEFDQLGKQPLVLNSIKTIRSYGGRYFIVSQTVPGLDLIYGEAGRRSLLGGAGIQIFMTPQDDRTAEVISTSLGKHTIVSKSESQRRIKDLDDSANVSRKSEERPLISSSEILRFPLDDVLILPEGQYPIRAKHIRYYEDRHFGPIDKARAAHPLPFPKLDNERKKTVPKLSAVATTAGTTPENNSEAKKGEFMEEIQVNFAKMSARAIRSSGPRKPPTAAKSGGKL